MRNFNYANEHQTYFYAALISAHASQGDKGFRQKHVRFYIELFSNWMSCQFGEQGLVFQNTQVARWLEGLTDESILTCKKKQHPLYFLSASGLLEITLRLVSLKQTHSFETFYFLFHLMKSYRNKILSMLVEERAYLPRGLEIEIKHLLDPKNLLEFKIQTINKEIEKLERRIEDVNDFCKLGNKLLTKEKNIDSVIKKIEEINPYQLNYQKKMSDLYSELPNDLKIFEISQAPIERIQSLWRPILKHYQFFKKQLEDLYNDT